MDQSSFRIFVHLKRRGVAKTSIQETQGAGWNVGRERKLAHTKPVPPYAFFNSTICTSDTSEKDTSKEMISMVRGRELKGMTYPVPVGMVGTIIRKDAETGK